MNQIKEICLKEKSKNPYMIWRKLIKFWLFCKCWGKRKQRSCEINQMRTAL